MKILRFWLLMLLAVLLPIRGAVSAAMMCPPAGVGTQSEVRGMNHPMGHSSVHHGEPAMAGHHDHAAHDHGSHGNPATVDAAGADDQGTGPTGSVDKCNVCSAFCSVTPLVSSALTVLEPLASAPTVFPALSAPVPAFLSDGQDRPPRSI